MLDQQYLDKKVRLNLKSKSSFTGASSYKESESSKNFGKGFSNPRGGRPNSKFNISKSFFFICCGV